MARQGRPVPTRRRTVHLSGMVVESMALPLVSFRVSCSAGAYMRQLAADAGDRLGVGGHVTALRRLRCGTLFNLLNSITLDRIEQAVKDGDLGFVRNPSEFMPDYLPVTIERNCEEKLRRGQPVPLACDAAVEPSAKVMAVRPGGTLIAIGEIVRSRQNTPMFQPKKVLV